MTTRPDHDYAHCSGCDRRWRSFAQCHCPTCHEQFAGITAFDKHRRGGECLPPSDVGLASLGRSDGMVWGRPNPMPTEIWPSDGGRRSADGQQLALTQSDDPGATNNAGAVKQPAVQAAGHDPR